MSSFCKCKSYSHFSSKNISINAIFNDQSFNDTLTNDIVSFEQLGPGVHSDWSYLLSRLMLYSNLWKCAFWMCDQSIFKIKLHTLIFSLRSMLCGNPKKLSDYTDVIADVRLHGAHTWSWWKYLYNWDFIWENIPNVSVGMCAQRLACAPYAAWSDSLLSTLWKVESSRKHTYLILTPLNPTFI